MVVSQTERKKIGGPDQNASENEISVGPHRQQHRPRREFVIIARSPPGELQLDESSGFRAAAERYFEQESAGASAQSKDSKVHAEASGKTPPGMAASTHFALRRRLARARSRYGRRHHALWSDRHLPQRFGGQICRR
jgi:hypothetical protein